MAKDTYIPRDEVVDMHKDFNRVRAHAEQELLRLPGVCAVGVGLKEVKGQLQRELVFKLTVDEKKGKAELRSKERIPDVLYGFKTDVVVPYRSIPGSDNNKYRPLIGGAQIEGKNGKSGPGTMGCLAKMTAAPNKVVVLTNWHVAVGKPDAMDGDKVGQPTHNGCCTCCACNEIAEVTNGKFQTDNMDAAIALLKGQSADGTPDERYLNEILGIGIIAGSATPLSGETVWKYGRATGLTKGQISNDNLPANTTYEYYGGISVNRTGQFEVTPVGFPDYFIQGDSGSVSVNEHNQVVLLNHAFVSATHKTIATNIVPVLAAMGIEIIDSTFHAAVVGKQGVPLSSLTMAPAMPSFTNVFADLEIELGQFSEGKAMLALFQQHRAELLELINHRREVMAAWNRYQGPSFLAHLARTTYRENKPLPEQIKGITMQSLLLKMTAVLQRHGSPELATAVAENYLKIMNVMSAGRSPQDWKAHLAHLDQIAHA